MGPRPRSLQKMFESARKQEEKCASRQKKKNLQKYEHQKNLKHWLVTIGSTTYQGGCLIGGENANQEVGRRTQKKKGGQHRTLTNQEGQKKKKVPGRLHHSRRKNESLGLGLVFWALDHRKLPSSQSPLSGWETKTDINNRPRNPHPGECNRVERAPGWGGKSPGGQQAGGGHFQPRNSTP